MGTATVQSGWRLRKKPQILFWLSFPPPILSITFTWCLTHICFWWACENCCPFSWMGNNHYEYGWSDIGTSSGISAHLRGERVKQDWVLRRLTTTANSKSFRKAFDQRRDRKLYSKLVCDLQGRTTQIARGARGEGRKKYSQQDSQAKIKTTAASWFVHIEYPNWAFCFV